MNHTCTRARTHTRTCTHMLTHTHVHTRTHAHTLFCRPACACAVERDQQRGALPSAQRDRQPAALPQLPYPLLLVRAAGAVHGHQGRGCTRADHACAAGAPHRQSPPPMGACACSRAQESIRMWGHVFCSLCACYGVASSGQQRAPPQT